MGSRVLSMSVGAALMLTAVAFPGSVFAQQASPFASPSSEAGPSTPLESPEDAIRAYLDGFARTDIERILSAAAADEMAQGFRHELLVGLLRSFTLSMDGPAHDPFFADLQHMGWQAQILGQVRLLAYSLLARDLLGAALDGMGVLQVDARWARDLQVQLDSTRLSSLVIADIRPPDPELSQSPKHLETLARMAEIYGADEMTERVVLLTFEDETYALGFSLLRYGDVWKVKSQSSALSRLPALGAAQPMTPEEYERLTSED